LKASKWLDNFANRPTAAATLSAPGYVNASTDSISGRFGGIYDLGAGLGTKVFKGNQMRFFRNGETNFPRRAHAVWLMAQYQRFGLLSSAPQYMKLAEEIILTDLYEKVAHKEGIAIPNDDMAPFKIALDHVTFNPKKPALEAARP